jgi:hypothetical protein
MDEYEFLIKEYEMSFEQLRYYDSRNNDFLKYLFTLTTSVAAAQFAIYKLSNSIDERFLVSHAFLSAVVFIASLLLYLSMLRNRVYFTHFARQLNGIRGFLLEKNAPMYENQLYTSTDLSAFKTSSVHTFQMIGAALLCGLYAGSFIFALAYQYRLPLIKGLITFALISIVLLITGSSYLISESKKSADDSINF